MLLFMLTLTVLSVSQYTFTLSPKYDARAFCVATQFASGGKQSLKMASFRQTLVKCYKNRLPNSVGIHNKRHKTSLVIFLAFFFFLASYPHS